MKQYILIAGANGVGKSTFYQYIGDQYLGIPRINPDEILSQDKGDWKSLTDQMTAMRKAVGLRRFYIENGMSFCQETTLCGASIFSFIQKVKQLGYIVTMHYIGVKSADLAVERVTQRMDLGGHGIPETDIRHRYSISLKNLKTSIEICDRISVYDNTERFIEIAQFENGVEIMRRDREYKILWLDRALGDSQF